MVSFAGAALGPNAVATASSSAGANRVHHVHSVNTNTMIQPYVAEVAECETFKLHVAAKLMGP